jgi:integration host factor subunit beta
MLKPDLVRLIFGQNPHLRQEDAERIVDAILEEVTSAMARGDRVELRGFGTFSARRRKPRTGRNPKTGALVPVEEKLFPFFKAGKEINERLNREPEGSTTP